MKLIHLSDLHLGKVVHGISMEREQKNILKLILALAEEEQPDAVLIAGDLYDRQQAPDYAVRLLDDFLSRLKNVQLQSGKPLQIFLISGNHDSAARISFGRALMDSCIHVSPCWQKGSVQPVTLQDQYGPVNFYLLPFISRFQIQAAFSLPFTSWTEAFRSAVADMKVNPEERNVLVAHQFVTGGRQSGSEESVGGLDNVDADVFADFDYVALGHIHRAQSAGRKTVRYCGSPLKYSFSEADQEKSLTVVYMPEKGREIEIRERRLTPEHDMVKLCGSFDYLMTDGVFAEHAEDYVHITLTDEGVIPNAASRLRQKYRNLMAMEYDNSTSRATVAADPTAAGQQKTALELLEEFYQMRHKSPENGQPLPMSPEQRKYAEETLTQIALLRSQAAAQTAPAQEEAV